MARGLQPLEMDKIHTGYTLGHDMKSGLGTGWMFTKIDSSAGETS